MSDRSDMTNYMREWLRERAKESATWRLFTFGVNPKRLLKHYAVCDVNEGSNNTTPLLLYNCSQVKKVMPLANTNTACKSGKFPNQ